MEARTIAKWLISKVPNINRPAQLLPLMQRGAENYRLNTKITCKDNVKQFLDKDKKAKSFGEVELFNGKKVSDLNKDSDQRKLLEDLFEFNKDAHNLMTSFSQAIKDINKKMKEENGLFTSDVAKHLNDLRGEALRGINLQHEAEKKELEALLNTPAFMEGVKNDLVGKGKGKAKEGEKEPEYDAEDVKQKMRDALDQAHQKQLDDFNKAVETDLKALHNQNNSVTSMIALMHSSEEMTQLFYRLLKEIHQDKGRKTTISTGEEDEMESVFKSMLLDKDLLQKVLKSGEFKSPSGIVAQVTDNSISLKLPKFDPTYYYASQNKIKLDLAFLAHAIRAQGHDSITFTIEYAKDPEYAKQLGRMAYEEAIKNGFDPNKVSIKLGKNAKPIEISELYKEHPHELERAKQKARDIKKVFNLGQLKMRPSDERTREFSEQLRHMRSIGAAGLSPSSGGGTKPT